MLNRQSYWETCSTSLKAVRKEVQLAYKILEQMGHMLNCCNLSISLEFIAAILILSQEQQQNVIFQANVIQCPFKNIRINEI